MANLALAFDILARDNASRVFQKVGDSAEDAGKKGGRFGSAVQKASGAAKVALAGLAAGAVAFGKSSVDAYVDASKQQRVLEDAYKRFPAIANVSIGALRDQAQALQNTTKFDGDAVNAMQGTLAQYKLNGKQIQDLTPLVLDYAQKTGKDLPDAAQVVGKAMLGQGRALKEIGINFKDTGSSAGNFTELMTGLRQQVGGFAAQEGKSAEGQAAILANNFGDLQEEIGSKLLPIAQKLTGWLIEAVKWIQENSGTVKVLVGVLGGLAAVIGTIIGVARVYTAVQTALNIVLAANPIGLVVVAIAALVAGLIYAYKNSETFRNIVNGAFDLVKKGAIALALVAVKSFHFLLSVWLEVAGGIINGAAWAFGWVPGLGPKLQTAATNFNSFKDSVNATLSKVETDLAVQLSTGDAKKKADDLAKYVRSRNYRVTAVFTYKTNTAGSAAAADRMFASGARASGGPMRSGGLYVVGDNPDGSWNKTTEVIGVNSPGRVWNQSQLHFGGTDSSGGYSRLHPHDIDALAAAITRNNPTAVVSQRNMMNAIGGAL